MIDLLTLRVVAAQEPTRGTVYRNAANEVTYECAECTLDYLDDELQSGSRDYHVRYVLERTSWLFDAGSEVVCEACSKVKLDTTPLKPF